MKLFIKDHIDIILLSVLNNLILVFGYYQLDGFSTVFGVLYFLFMSLFLLFLILAYRYYRKKKVYQMLAGKPGKLEDMVAEDDSDSFTLAFSSYNKQNYQHFLQELNQSRETADEWQSRIVRWVHQMKTPISVIRLMVQTNPEQLNILDIDYELDRLQSQMDSMLGFVRMGDLESDFVIEEISLKKLADEIVLKNKRQFAYHHVSPEILIPEDAIVRSDRKWLGFVIEQILNNAVKYSGKDSRIQIYTREISTRVELTVRDFGIGIRERDLPRVFERYYTGSNGREHDQSSGIGLYMVKRILDELGHSIQIRSEIEKGTSVAILF